MWEWREGWTGVWPAHEGGGTWHEGQASMWPANEGGRALHEGWEGAWPADEGSWAWDMRVRERENQLECSKHDALMVHYSSYMQW